MPHAPLCSAPWTSRRRRRTSLRHAVAFAAGPRPDGDGRASLTLLHVVEPLLVQAAAMTSEPTVLQDECRQALAALAVVGRRRRRSTQPPSLEVRVGLPHVEILGRGRRRPRQPDRHRHAGPDRRGAAVLRFDHAARAARDGDADAGRCRRRRTPIVRDDGAGPALAHRPRHRRRSTSATRPPATVQAAAEPRRPDRRRR